MARGSKVSQTGNTLDEYLDNDFNTMTKKINERS